MLKFEFVLLAFVVFMCGLFGIDQVKDIPVWVYVVVFLIFFAITFWGTVSIRSNFYLRALSSGITDEKVISLTFDDGPAENTIRISKLLKQHNAIGTFFCIGKNVARSPGVLKKLDDHGHVIANHSYTHSTFFDFQFSQEIVEEINLTERQIEQAIGKKVALFRPPYGITTPHIKKAVNQLNYKVIGWNVRSMDTVINDLDKLTDRVISRIKPGAIVLLHDTTPHLEELLKRVLAYCKENGYRCVGVDELLKIEAYA